MKVAVSGASGHIGYHVARLLLEKGYEVILLLRSTNDNILRLQKMGAKVHLCDLFLPETYENELGSCEGVFHLAAENTTRKDNKEQVVANTAGLSETFLTASVKKGVNKIVYTSSVVVLGRSKSKSKLLNETDRADFFESPYVEGKAKAENWVNAFRNSNNADIRKVYPSWVIGPGDLKTTPPHKIIRNYVAKGQFFYFPGGISIASVEAVAQGHILAFEKGMKQGDYVLGGENITFKKFYDILAKHSGYKKPFIKIPRWLIIAGAYATSPVFRLMNMTPLLEPSYAKSVFGNYSWYDSSKAIREISYKPESADIILSGAVKDARKRLAGVLSLGMKKSEVLPADDTAKGKLLITGVPGWLGNRMVDVMINGDKNGNYCTSREVVLFVQPGFKDFLHLPENFKIIYGDLTDKSSIYPALEGVKTVFHLAGAIYPARIKTLYKVNVEGTKNLVDACIEKGVNRILYMSTDSVCGKGTKQKRIFDATTTPAPYKHYGKSKYLAEKYLLDKTKEGQIRGTSLRGFWFFGPFAPPRQLSFINMFYLPRQIVFGNGKNYRSISHVDNTIQAFFKAEKQETTVGKWYWLCGDESKLTVDDIYSTIAKELGLDYKPLYIPVWMCRLAGLADSVFNKFGFLNSTLHAAGKFYFDIAGDNSAAKDDFDFKPEVGLKEAAGELKTMISR